MNSSPGVVRPHWQKFSEGLQALGNEELARRWENARRIISDHGVSYNIYGDPRGLDRPWELDPIPMLLAPVEWQNIEAALIQRARLLNSILADVYGPQKLLQDGSLPAPLVLGNPAFLRPCHGLRVPGGVHLHLYAADIARSPDGQWWVLGDHAQGPAGAGYALENRIVMARALAELYRENQVQRLAPFFAVVRETLMHLAGNERPNPRVVLLTPGPQNETYFEHAFLARYLGYSLVEGGDLTVRDCKVYLKTLEGLQPVDVILRRMNDELCDPLELQGDSFLGVAGLVEAAHAGNVAIANALGSGLAESPGLMPFLPALARSILGEELKMPSVATWWCGQDEAQQHVVEHLDQLVIKTTNEVHFGGKLSAAQKKELIAKVRARPSAFVGEELVSLSGAPVWNDEQLQTRPVALRVYAVASGDSYIVMPGGLTRVASSGDTVDVSLDYSGGSKDTWVISDGPVKAFSLLRPPTQKIELQSAATDLPSRVADNLFWLGRYAERAEDKVRLLRCVLPRLTYESGASSQFVSLMQILDSLGLIHAGFKSGKDPARALERELFSVIFKHQRHASLRETLNRLHRMAWLVRSRLSADTWRILNQLHHDVARSRPVRADVEEALALLNRVITALSAFGGMEMENMTRGHGWRFLDMGRRIERAMNLVTLVRTSVPEVPHDEAGILEALLEVADSSMTYRARYFTAPHLAGVLDLLLKDKTNPRSVAFQFVALNDHVENLPRDPDCPLPSREQTIVRESLAKIEQTDVRQEDGLEELLLRLSANMRALSNTITHYYFSHASRSQQIG